MNAEIDDLEPNHPPSNWSLPLEPQLASRTSTDRDSRLHQFAIAHMLEGLLWVTFDGKILDANPAICKLFDCHLDQLKSRSLFEVGLLPTAAAWSRYWSQARQSPVIIVTTYVGPNGQTYALELNLRYCAIEHQEYCCIHIRDCTAQLNLELELEKTEVRLDYKTQELAEAIDMLRDTQMQLAQGEKMSTLGNLVAGVAHEINNPIGFLSGNIDHALSYVEVIFQAFALYETNCPEQTTALQTQFEQLDLGFIRHDLPKLIQSMHEGIRRVQSLSDSLRNFSRADTEHKIPACIQDGVDSTLLILKHRLKANESRGAINVICDYDNTPLEIECFPGQLNQVFMNILANAIDAIDEGIHAGQFNHQTASPQICINITSSDDFESVIIRFKDNGPGMPAEVKNRIFERLFTTKEFGKGTGLGLAIAHEIITEKHGGILRVESTLDVGTEFIVQLPVIDTRSTTHVSRGQRHWAFK
ncbi:GHKL domain-containing protein [filamentous cyanobacterium LEGE 11480]|uniref:histidine kinase n=1 Tax=Romeriopsis navalis LEGE 11480 TaxID=2777977 RepID=A0A928VRX8_9CYAN|nr:PAS domain-containing sensor histidine kinase [Romeriopsis navalis]MBE9030999.1 GHKL domain-containing protein [Romeriopsis navalis LEGE 11480]